MKITENDFKIFNQRRLLSGSSFCGNCDEEVTSSDCDEDGYTYCCNEPNISRSDFLKSAKFIDINNFVKKFSEDYYIAEARGSAYGHEVYLGNAKSVIRLDLNSSIDHIVAIFNIYA